jgi:hypothetical protein
MSTTTRRWAAWVAAIAACGLFLRCQQLDIQWLTDDEWHVVHKVASGATYGELALSVGEADFSIPQALAYKWLAERGGIGEFAMRLPTLVAGLALMVGGAWWAWRNFGVAPGLGFMSLLAISPTLVYYSRNARPYGLTMTLSWGALLALLHWRETGRTRWACVYAAAAVLASWLHAAVAPFVAAPLAVIALRDALTAWRARRWAPMVASWPLGAAVAVAILALAGLPMLLNHETLAMRMGKDLPRLSTYAGVCFIWLGTRSGALVALCMALAAWGALEMRRRRPDVLAMAAAGTAATVAAVYWSRPAWVHNAVTFARYLLPLAPLLLLCVALGAVAALRRVAGWETRPRRAATILGFGAMVAALFFSGPGPELLARPNNFFLHSWHQFDYRHSLNPVRSAFLALPESPFWRRLGESPPGSLRLAVGGHELESYTIAAVRWQAIHRQRVWNAQLAGYCGSGPHWGEVDPVRGFHLENAVSLADPVSLRRTGIDYIVFDLAFPSGRTAGCVERLARDYGAPAYTDDFVVAFRLPDGRTMGAETLP